MQHNTLLSQLEQLESLLDSSLERHGDKASCPTGTVQTRLEYSAKLRPIACVWPSERDAYVSKTISSGGVWDRMVVDAMMASLETAPKGSLVVDVGSNVGQFSLLAAAAGHRVVAFDVMPAHVQMLDAAARLNRFPERILARAAMVSKRDGRAEFEVHGDNNLGGTSARLLGLERTERAVSLDSALTDGGKGGGGSSGAHLFGDSQWPLDAPVAFVKIDAEGSEPEILEGARRFFRARRPRALALEISRKEWSRRGYDTPSVLEGVQQHGYSMRRLLDARVQQPVVHDIRNWEALDEDNTVDVLFQI